MAAKLKCPKGHAVKAGGPCTPVHCRKKVKGAKAVRTQRPREVDADIEDLEEAEEEETALVKDSLEVERENLKRSIASADVEDQVVHEQLRIPRGLEGEAAESWADGRMVSLLPRAVAEFERQLRWGDAKARLQAAQQVLDSTGRGKQDRGGASGPAIVINLGAGGLNLPWRSNVTVEGQGSPTSADLATSAAKLPEGEKP